jgi:hypothetical protein
MDTPTPTTSPEPYLGLSISSLAARSYGGGEITVKAALVVNSYLPKQY